MIANYNKLYNEHDLLVGLRELFSFIILFRISLKTDPFITQNSGYYKF